MAGPAATNLASVLGTITLPNLTNHMNTNSNIQQTISNQLMSIQLDPSDAATYGAAIMEDAAAPPAVKAMVPQLIAAAKVPNNPMLGVLVAQANQALSAYTSVGPIGRLLQGL